MDLPRLGEYFSPDDLEASEAQPTAQEIPPQPRAPAPEEPLPAWLCGDAELYGDEKLFGENDFDDLDPDDGAQPAIGLRGLRWIRKNMSSFKVTVSLQRPTPPPGKPRKLS